jgi:hypothetical protein
MFDESHFGHCRINLKDVECTSLPCRFGEIPFLSDISNLQSFFIFI